MYGISASNRAVDSGLPHGAARSSQWRSRQENMIYHSRRHRFRWSASTRRIGILNNGFLKTSPAMRPPRRFVTPMLRFRRWSAILDVVSMSKRSNSSSVSVGNSAARQAQVQHECGGLACRSSPARNSSLHEWATCQRCRMEMGSTSIDSLCARIFTTFVSLTSSILKRPLISVTTKGMMALRLTSADRCPEHRGRSCRRKFPEALSPTRGTSSGTRRMQSGNLLGRNIEPNLNQLVPADAQLIKPNVSVLKVDPQRPRMERRIQTEPDGTKRRGFVKGIEGVGTVRLNTAANAVSETASETSLIAPPLRKR